jgi:hypothetical protein
LRANLIEPTINLFNTPSQKPSIRLKLSFTRASQANTTFLPLQMGPTTNEARGHMLKLGKLYLQLAFMSTGALGKNIKDKASTI